jgi:glutamate-ammonia-ligase adenylyltransferase
VRIAWRDLAGLADVVTVLRELSQLADACIEAACRYAGTQLAARHGAPVARDGSSLPLLVLGMGKLGGGELNFSSDIDLIFVFPEKGETSGGRSIEFEEYFARLGTKVAQLLGTVTADGFVYRVDLRLRPFGESGPVAVSFDAFEDYLQQHGRDWERYAYVKARPVSGGAGFDELYRNVLRPFVYRRYLDFGVLESLRGWGPDRARSRAPRAAGDAKLGPAASARSIHRAGVQLIRGGASAAAARSLLEALPQLAGQKLLAAEAVAELAESYRFLRRLENRLQEWNDEQTHELPATEPARERLALAMNHDNWNSLDAEIAHHRDRVSAWFRRTVFAPAQPEPGDGASADSVRLLDDDFEDARRLEVLGLGLRSGAAVLERLAGLRQSVYYRRLDETGRRRLRTLVPRLLRAIAGGDEDTALGRVLHVIERIGGRTVYLALLNENSVARQRLIELCAHSQFLTDQIAAFPLLLDELLDERLFRSTPTRAELAGSCRHAWRRRGGDPSSRSTCCASSARAMSA